MGTRLVIAAVAMGVVVAADLAARPGVARAASAPEVAAVIEGVDAASGRGTLTVAGKKVGKFKTFSIRDLDGAVVGPADLVFKSSNLVTLRLPEDLPPGDYRLALEPKKGAATLADFAYQATRFSFPAGRDVGIGTTSPLATLDVQGTVLVQDTARFLADTSTIGDADVGGMLTVGEGVIVMGTVDVVGSVLAGGVVEQTSAYGSTRLDAVLDEPSANTTVATFTSNLNAGALLRLERDPAGDGFSFGQDFGGSFVIDDLTGARLFELGTAGRLSLGASGGTSQLFVNTSPFNNATCAITQRTGDALTFGIFEPDGDAVLQVAGQDVAIAQGDLLVSSGDVQVTEGNLGIVGGDFTVSAGNVSVNAGSVVVGTGNVTLNSGDLVVGAGDAFKPGGGAWGTVSDRRLKKNIEPLAGALERLSALRGVTYEYRNPDAIGELHGRQTGLIAQEVEEVFPTWVGERADGMKYVAPKGFEALAATALRELRAEKDAQLAGLRDENAALRERLARLEAADAARETRLLALEKALLDREPDGAADGR